MTERKDFKRVVRERARRTGESYSTALRHVRGPSEATPAPRRPFAERFAAVRTALGPLVWGVDPHSAVLEAWGVADTPDGLDRFVDIVLDAAVGVVGLIKPQSAFFERHGWRGMRSLTRLVTQARAAGLLVIVDAKRGDVGSTNDAYADAFLGAGAPIEADALTVHPYLGVEALGAFVTRAHEAGSCVLVVTRSSNPEGERLQSARDETGVPVDAAILDEVGRLNDTLAPGTIGPVGCVVGPNHGSTPLDLAAAHGLFLAPGLGKQGATARDVARVFAACPDRVMPSVSRSLLERGPDRSRLRDAASQWQSELRGVLGWR